MQKIAPSKPLLIMLYGYPGTGKTHFAHSLSEALGAAHLHGDRIRHELFEHPKHAPKEDEIIEHLMRYMAQEFLHAGVSVIYDADSNRLAQRRGLREISRRCKAQPLLIWIQIDAESAKLRIKSRDRRKSDDKFAVPYSSASFEKYAGVMQNPVNEDYMVISGKHTFNTQKSAVIKKLYELGVISADNASNKVVKPGMVNLVPNLVAGRVDMSRRNIAIK